MNPALSQHPMSSSPCYLTFLSQKFILTHTVSFQSSCPPLEVHQHFSSLKHGNQQCSCKNYSLQIPEGKRNISPVFQPFYSPKALSDEGGAFLLMTLKTPLSPRNIIPTMLADCWLCTLRHLGGLTKPSCNSKAVCLQLHVLRLPCHTQPSQFMSSCYIILDTSQFFFSENKWKEMLSSSFFPKQCALLIQAQLAEWLSMLLVFSSWDFVSDFLRLPPIVEHKIWWKHFLQRLGRYMENKTT